VGVLEIISQSPAKMKTEDFEAKNYIFIHEHLTGVISKRSKCWRLEITCEGVVINNTAKNWNTRKAAKKHMEEIFNKY